MWDVGSEKRVINSQNNRKVNICTLYLLLVKRIDNFLSGLSQWAWEKEISKSEVQNI